MELKVRMMNAHLLGLAVFDLDGTLLRGSTACEIIAEPLGRLDRMKQFEGLSSEHDVAAARTEMAGWYCGIPLAELTAPLGSATVAPGAYDGIALLRRRGIAVAIASITWEFAVEWFARRLQIDYYVGTRLEDDGNITHFWPRDKATWVEGLRDTLGVPASRVAAIGDSRGDLDMLCAVGHPAFVGATLLSELPGVTHFPGADIITVAHWINERLG